MSGTSVAGLVFWEGTSRGKGGVIIGADTLTCDSDGPVDWDAMKLTSLNEYIFYGSAGDVIDIEKFDNKFKDWKSERLNTDTDSILVEEAAAFAANLINNNEYAISMIIGGIDPWGGPELYRLSSIEDLHNDVISPSFQSYAGIGSGGLYARDYLRRRVLREQEFSHTRADTAKKTCCMAISAGMENDFNSGGDFDVGFITTETPQVLFQRSFVAGSDLPYSRKTKSGLKKERVPGM